MNIISILAIPLMIVGIVVYGMAKRINVYDSFVEGAKSGIENMVQIIPPLVGLMVGITMLRESGFMDVLGQVLKPLTNAIGMPKEVLPLALLRPVSGSGSIAIVNDIFKNMGPDSQAGRIASVMMGSTETTFYTVAVYFGAVGIKNLRYTLKSALVADLCGMLIAVFVARLLLL
ncbi:MAG: spore maturation protein [Clostridia bacterium]|nr:spore maturation protein [Clostridia bacterium]